MKKGRPSAARPFRLSVVIGTRFGAGCRRCISHSLHADPRLLVHAASPCPFHHHHRSPLPHTPISLLDYHATARIHTSPALLHRQPRRSAPSAQATVADPALVTSTSAAGNDHTLYRARALYTQKNRVRSKSCLHDARAKSFRCAESQARGREQRDHEEMTYIGRAHSR